MKSSHKRLLAGVFLLALVFGACRGRGKRAPESPAGPEAKTFSLPVQLYFPGEDGRLYVERRDLVTTEEPEQQIEALVRALLAGPESSVLTPPFPPEVELSAVYLRGDGIAYVDLKGTGAVPPGAGSTEDRQRLMSLVDTVTLNVSEARRMVLLWNGSQLESFGGHFDTSRPLAADTSLVAR